MQLRDVPIIPKGRCSKALDATPEYVTKLEEIGVLTFTQTPTGRKYTTFDSLESAAEWLRRQELSAAL